MLGSRPRIVFVWATVELALVGFRVKRPFLGLKRPLLPGARTADACTPALFPHMDC